VQAWFNSKYGLTIQPLRYYSYYVVIELKLSRIGNSKGIRLPASLLKRYQIEDVVLVEEGSDSITLRPRHTRKLSWNATAAEMAREKENWLELEAALGDGLDQL